MDAMTLAAESVAAVWQEEIERAIDRVKLSVSGPGRRTALDRWLRRMWYINEWRGRHRQGPTPTRD